MPNLKSSKKAVKIIAKKTANNHELKARVRNAIKNCEKTITAKDSAAAESASQDVKKIIDRALSKGLIKKNTANRQKSRLTKKVKDLSK